MKIKTFGRLFLLLIFLFVFLSENPLLGQTYFVIPHHGNTLKLQKKNDLKFEWGSMIENQTRQNKTNQQFQLGYAPKDWLGISIFHSTIENQYKRDFEPIVHNSQHTGIEVGTFYKKNFNYNLNWRNSKRSLKRKGILGSFYLGYANGNLSNMYFDFSDDPVNLDGTVKMNFHKLYTNAGIHWMGRRIEYSAMVKAGKMNFYKGKIDGLKFGGDFSDISAITQNNIYTFFDYTLKAEINMAIFGVYGQLTGSHIKNLNYSPVIKGDVGIVIYLSELKKNWLKRKELRKG